MSMAEREIPQRGELLLLQSSAENRNEPCAKGWVSENNVEGAAL